MEACMSIFGRLRGAFVTTVICSLCLGIIAFGAEQQPSPAETELMAQAHSRYQALGITKEMETGRSIEHLNHFMS